MHVMVARFASLWIIFVGINGLPDVAPFLIRHRMLSGCFFRAFWKSALYYTIASVEVESVVSGVRLVTDEENVVAAVVASSEILLFPP